MAKILKTIVTGIILIAGVWSLGRVVLPLMNTDSQPGTENLAGTQTNEQNGSVATASTTTESSQAKVSTNSTLSTTTKSTATSTQTAKSVKKPITVTAQTPPPTAPSEPTIQTGATATQPPADFEKINQSSRPAEVNLFCTQKDGNKTSYITGSGTIVSPQGVILTNAHIAQFWLLHDYPQTNATDCVIRTGSPAYPTYRAELLYISPRWIADNKTLLKSAVLLGTGEHDYALLHITSKIDGTPLPSAFSYVQPSTYNNIAEGQPMVLVSYPAGLLGSEFVLKDLNAISAITTVQQIYSFDQTDQSRPEDLIAIGGTVVTQKGSSGGAVIDANKNLVGVIVTESGGSAISTKDIGLYAITGSHIDRSIREEIGYGLIDLLAADPSTTAKTFMTTTGVSLSKTLLEALLP